jgi:hypothetical protein
MADAHTVPDGAGSKVEHDGRTVSTHSTQDEAINAGRTEAEIHRCEVAVHGADGQIREKDSGGNDPRNVPG